jgi:hypothetical protein
MQNNFAIKIKELVRTQPQTSNPKEYYMQSRTIKRLDPTKSRKLRHRNYMNALQQNRSRAWSWNSGEHRRNRREEHRYGHFPFWNLAKRPPQHLIDRALQHIKVA